MIGWRSTETAPRDGTLVEIKCTYGVKPWVAPARWSKNRYDCTEQQVLSGNGLIAPAWVLDDPEPSSVNEVRVIRSIEDGPHIRWRPVKVDPWWRRAFASIIPYTP